MKSLLIAGGLLAVSFGLGVSSSTALAVGICKCDSKTGFESACLPICKEANEKMSFFRPAVYFGKDKKVNADKTPLNGTSMKFLYLSHPSRAGMESFRKYLEKHRKVAETEFKKMKRAYLHGHVGPEEFKQAEKVRDEALVNYYHGMRAYLTTPSPRPTSQ